MQFPRPARTCSAAYSFGRAAIPQAPMLFPHTGVTPPHPHPVAPFPPPPRCYATVRHGPVSPAPIAVSVNQQQPFYSLALTHLPPPPQPGSLPYPLPPSHHPPPFPPPIFSSHRLVSTAHQPVPRLSHPTPGHPRYIIPNQGRGGPTLRYRIPTPLPLIRPQLIHHREPLYHTVQQRYSHQPNTHPNLQPNTHPNLQPNIHPNFRPNTHPNLQPNTHPNFQPNPHPNLQPNPHQMQQYSVVSSQTVCSPQPRPLVVRPVPRSQDQQNRLCSSIEGSGVSIARASQQQGGATPVLQVVPVLEAQGTSEMEEYHMFAAAFRNQRRRLGFSQTDLVQQLNIRYNQVFTLRNIQQLEGNTLSLATVRRLKPVLEAWLRDTATASGTSSDEMNVFRVPTTKINPHRERKKRTSIDTYARQRLEAEFVSKPKPTQAQMAQLAAQLRVSKDFVRVWFSNRRQRQKREESYSIVGSTIPSPDYDITVEVPMDSVEAETQPNTLVVVTAS